MKKKMSKRKRLTIIQKILTILCICLAVAVSVSAIYLIIKNTSDKPDVTEASQANLSTSESKNTSDTQTTVTATESTTAATTESSTASSSATSETQTYSKSEETTASASVTDEKTTSATASSSRIVVYPSKVKYWNLIVVNSGREIPEGYIPQLEYVAGSDVRMDYRVAPYYDKMYYAAKEDGITLTPYSGYRTYERQKINYENLTNQYMSQYGLSRADAAKKAATVILPPGTSEHNLGLAMDICNTYDSFANQPEYRWLMNNAYKYGFILRYTAEKKPITGIVPEPWHWRYVGVEYAEKIKDSGLCLEEYLDSVGIAY